MGVEEKASGIVKEVTEGFRGNPTCLAAVILAGLFAGLTYLALRDEQNRAQQRFNQVVNLCWFDHKADVQKSTPPLDDR